MSKKRPNDDRCGIMAPSLGVWISSTIRHPDSFSAMLPRGYVLMITAPILATSMLLLIVGGTAAWYVHRLNLDLSVLLSQNVDCTLASERLVLSIRDARLQMHRFLDTGDERELLEVENIEKRISEHLRDVAQVATTEEIRQLIGNTQQNHDRFSADFAAVMRDTAPAELHKKMRDLMRSISDDLLAPADRLLQLTQEAAVTHTFRNRKIADSVGLGLIVLGACGAVGGLMAGFGMARGVARRIEQSEREASRSEQLAAVGQLAAGLAHELRNPLTAIRVLVEASRDQSVGGLDQRDLEVLDEEIARLENLVQSFLDFARPPELEKFAIDARTLIEQTLQLVGGPARQRGVTIHWQRPAEAVVLEADPVQMRQVLLNLLLNAMDAAGEGGKVSVELEAEAGGAAVNVANPSRQTPAKSMGEPANATCSLIHISDTGAGVPDHMKQKIFEPFVSTKETGIGLGLAVSRRIVEAHGGAIIVADNPGGGARFTICSPSSDRGPACRCVDKLSSQGGSM